MDERAGSVRNKNDKKRIHENVFYAYPDDFRKIFKLLREVEKYKGLNTLVVTIGLIFESAGVAMLAALLAAGRRGRGAQTGAYGRRRGAEEMATAGEEGCGVCEGFGTDAAVEAEGGFTHRERAWQGGGMGGEKDGGKDEGEGGRRDGKTLGNGRESRREVEEGFVSKKI